MDLTVTTVVIGPRTIYYQTVTTKCTSYYAKATTELGEMSTISVEAHQSMVHTARLLQTAVLLLIVVVVLSVLAGGDGGVVIGAKVATTIDQPRRETGRARRAAATGNERTKARRPFLFRSDHHNS